MSVSVGTTNLAELPPPAQTPSSSFPPNISLGIQENTKVQNTINDLESQRDNDPATHQKHINGLVTGIQQASMAGLTELPSRDIPQIRQQLTQDEQSRVNYIPEKSQDYIGNVPANDAIIKEQQTRHNKSDSLDTLYERFQTPILVAILYFLFQLPIVKNGLLRFIPSLFNKDGNPHLSGYLSQSISFGMIYDILINLVHYFGIA